MRQPLQYFSSERRGIVITAVVSFFGATLEAVTLILLVPVAQAVANAQQSWEGHLGPATISVSFNTLVVLTASAIVATAALALVGTWLRTRMTNRWELHTRRLVMAEFLDAEWATQATDRSGNLQTLVSYVGRGSQALGALMFTVKSFLTVTTFVVLAVFIDWRAAIMIIASGLVLFAALRPLMGRVRSQSRTLAHLFHGYAQEMGEVSLGARDIRVFGARDAVESQLESLSNDYARTQFRQSILQGMLVPTYQYGGMAFVLAALVVASRLTTVNVTAIGAIALLLLRSLSYGQQLQTGYQSMVESMPFVDHLEAARDSYRAHAMVDGTEELAPVETVTLDHVSYSYDGIHDALRDVSLTLRQGTIVGVVGPSGSGKSTMSQILLRLRDPSSGSVLVNGRPATSYTISSWYSRFSLVPQDPRLLHASVADNITLFDDTISRDRVVEASRMAGMHEIVEGLEHGYDTPVGAAFRDMSGGQIQRIGIARALLREPDVLVLDEPTSALDVHSEALVQEALELLRGRTLLVIIAHRLSTLSICDELVVLERGVLTAAGPLAAVRESNPFFRKALETGTLDVDRAAG